MKTASLQKIPAPLPRAGHVPSGRGLSFSIFSEIKKDHAVFRKAMKRIQKLYPTDPERAKAAYSEFRVKLQAHAHAEQETLYTYLLGKSKPGQKLDDEVREEIEEHHLADLLINEISQIPAVDPKWKAKFRVLQESVDHHLDEEEEYFKRWRRTLSRSEDRMILARFISRRKILLTEAVAVHH